MKNIKSSHKEQRNNTEIIRGLNKDIKMESAFDYLIKEIYSIPTSYEREVDKIVEKAKKLKKEEKTYTEEQVREALFFALNVDKTNCCTTRTTDSIVREAIKSIKK